MKEVLEFIFSGFWVFFGTCLLIMIIGHAVSLPFFWYYKVRQIRLSKSIWKHPEN